MMLRYLIRVTVAFILLAVFPGMLAPDARAEADRMPPELSLPDIHASADIARSTCHNEAPPEPRPELQSVSRATPRSRAGIVRSRCRARTRTARRIRDHTKPPTAPVATGFFAGMPNVCRRTGARLRQARALARNAGKDHQKESSFHDRIRSAKNHRRGACQSRA